MVRIYPFWGSVQAAELAAVATSGAYSDLTGRPTLGTAAEADLQTSVTDVTSGRVQRADYLSQAPAILDAARYALEKTSRGRNTILYNAGREEIHVVRLDAYSYADLGSAYSTGMGGAGILEAFQVSGVARDHLWIGKYPASRSASGRVVCQPMLDPWISINWDEAVAACAALGTVSGHTARLMSTWDWAAIAHQVMASGRGQPRGNTDYGRAYDALWQRARRVDGALPGVITGTPRTLAGTGPREWNHDLGEFGIADLVGNLWEWCAGFSVSAGVVSLAADNGTVTTEGAWAAQNGYTLSPDVTWASVATAGASNALKRALIVPATGVTSPAGFCYLSPTGTFFPCRGGGLSSADRGGLAALLLYNARSAASISVGFRPVFVPS